MRHWDKVEQMRALVKKRKKILDSIHDPRTKRIIGARLDDMEDLVNLGDYMKEDNWNEGYVGRMSRHKIGIRAAGITEKMKGLEFSLGRGNRTKLYDQNGQEFDDLRTRYSEKNVSRVADFKEYMQKIGGDHSKIEGWAGSQASDSWNEVPIKMKDPKTGKQYVWKEGANANHLRGEYTTEEIYRAAGMRVPRSEFYEAGTGFNATNKTVKLSEFKDDLKPLASLKGDKAKVAISQASEGMGADALVANWDVAGLEGDNLMVDGKGQVWRIDVGGSLEFRAQGALKPSWGDHPEELWT